MATKLNEIQKKKEVVDILTSRATTPYVCLPLEDRAAA